MNFQVLQHQLSQIKEIAVISRNAEIDGVICHVMGMVRRDNHTLQMLILQYDEAYQEKLAVAEIADLTNPPVELITNRIEQRRDRNLEPPPRFGNVEKVCIGKLELMTNESSSGICRMKEQFSPEELAQSKADFEGRFSAMCPKGMCYSVIEYECEEDISLQTLVLSHTGNARDAAAWV
ncbi:MAG: hypothetical protein ACYDEJ_02930 [Desulfitobacteriaceae bacterium]